MMTGIITGTIDIDLYSALIVGKDVLMAGRIHYYEGEGIKSTVKYIDKLRKAGVETLIILNAVGSLNKKFKVGDITVIKDHISLLNLTGLNPLIDGKFKEDKFIMPTYSYQNEVINTGKRQGVKIKESVYCQVSGPTYETKAEIKMLQKLGADTVGMSMANEVTYANYLGMKAIGISIVTNECWGKPVTHNIVKDVVENKKSILSSLIDDLVIYLYGF